MSTNILVWSEEQLIQNIEFAIEEIKQKVISSYDENKLEYVAFAFENALKHVSSNCLDDQLFIPLCSAVDDIFFTTLDGLESNLESSVNKLTQFDSREAKHCLLTIWQRLFQSLRIACENLSFYSNIQCNKIVKFITCLRLIIQEASKYYEQNIQTIPELGEDLWQFNSQFSKLIISVVVFDECSNEDVEVLTNLVHDMVKTAKNSLSKSRIQLVESWKHLINFVEKNQIISQTVFEVNDAITTLCHYISANLSDLANLIENSIKSQFQTLKVDNFILKIIVKLCKTHKDFLTTCYSDLVVLLLSLFRLTPSYLRAMDVPQNVVCEIHRHVTMASDPLLSTICTDAELPQKIKAVLREHNNTNPYGSTIFLISLLKKIHTLRLKNLYFTSLFNTVDLIFESFSQCHVGLIGAKYYGPGTAVTQIELKADLYEYVFNSIAVFTLTLSADDFVLAEDTFLVNILQTNPWKAIMVSDIWCLVARYASVQVCHSTLDTLIGVMNEMNPHSARPEFTYMVWMIRRMLQFCEPQYLNDLALKFPLYSNGQIWRILGLRSSADLPFIQDLCSNITNWIDCKHNGVEGYLHLVNSLQTLGNSFYLCDLDDSTVDAICSLWAVRPITGNGTVWTNFVFSLTVLTSTILRHKRVQNHHIIMVLKRITCILDGSQTAGDELCALLVLKNALGAMNGNSFQQDDFTNFLSVFQKLLTSSCPILSAKALTTFSEYAQNSTYSSLVELIGLNNEPLQNILVDFFKKQIPRDPEETKMALANYEHICSSFQHKSVSHNADDECNPKRMKMDHRNDTINDILDRMEKDCAFILNKQSFLDNNQQERISAIGQTLISLIKT